MFRQILRRCKSDFVLAKRAPDGSLKIADIKALNRDLTWMTPYFAEVELNETRSLIKLDGVAQMQNENLVGKILSMNANPGGKSAPHGFIKDGEQKEYYFQPKKCPIGLTEAVRAHEEALEVTFDVCELGKTGLRALNVRVKESK
ncbi:Oidioi.mRNA.OKI2018_I69.PAR.g11113.t1.cds [Oikopleura dioica]|uniref:Oidioi.mRNA.OKI2018_I69.PAR.g11113.t1.cds n=1 Tax=Oikopleura dioica TaxID=34765 RepID=A0ABN7S1E3_OIKDI|nr:Oidioi.mRNA.OKI2018_I69.PAR.g11113.t1.cds [Oikopleura dioica]